MIQQNADLISWCELRIILQPDVMVFLLLVPELRDCLDELPVSLRISVGQLPDLVVVVLGDARLHRHGARHRRLLPKKSCTSAKGVPGNLEIIIGDIHALMYNCISTPAIMGGVLLALIWWQV